MQLSEFEIREAIKPLGLNEAKIRKVIEIYDAVKFENINRDLGRQDLISLVQDIGYQVGRGEKEERIYREHSDIKHLEYLNIILGEEEGNLAIEALRNARIPTDVLRGLRLNITSDLSQYISGLGFVNVYQEFAEPAPGESPILKEFYIELNNEVIYSFKNPSFRPEDFDFREQDFKNQAKLTTSYTNVKREKQIQKKVKNLVQLAKSNKINRSKGIIDRIYISDNDYANIYVRTSKKGKKSFFVKDNKTGRFVSMHGKPMKKSKKKVK